MYENDMEYSGYDPLVGDGVSNDMKPGYDDENGFRESTNWFSGSTVTTESLDFDEVESVMWRKHQLRRFFQDRGHFWTSARQTTALKWILVVLIGLLIGCCGAFVQHITELLTNWRFQAAEDLIDKNAWADSFFAYITISLIYGGVAGGLAWIVPYSAGSGMPEIKSLLNGVGLRQVVHVKVLLAKIVGVCFSVASGIPVGKEGPMIHIGAIMGAAVSQGKTITFGFDTSWTKFQDFRSDRAKRDFITYGAAAGVAAAFRAPIGGVLLTLEEGASFWSTSITFRSFFCAMVSLLTVSVIFAGHNYGRDQSSSIFSFGQFDNLEDGKNNYHTYEIPVFILMGCIGGILGAIFNTINMMVMHYRLKHINSFAWKRLVELLLFVFTMGCISFFLPLMWQQCTDIPSDTSEWTTQERDLLDELVPFQCGEAKYNQLASLYFTSGDTALRQLFHYREYDHSNYATFDTSVLLLFFIPYFLMAACASGTFAPTGLLVPCIIAGAAFGRLCGHLMNNAFPGYVADSGTYALIGSAAVLGGVLRMTISGTVIILEAAGNTAYLLPLMVTFGAARYVGNAFNRGMYELQIALQNLPFLPGSLEMHKFGLLTYFPVAEIMAQPVIVFNQISKVSRVYQVLMDSKHNGFPVIGKNGHMTGLILRKTLCTLLKLKAYSIPHDRPVNTNATGDSAKISGKILAPHATVFYDTLERNYPRYPKIEDIKLTPEELDLWIDLRPYMDTAPYSINQSASVQRCYRLFRTMGLRHIVVVDSDHLVVGMVTRKDITTRRLDLHWFREGHNLQKFINVDAIPAAIVHPNGTEGENNNNISSVETPQPVS